MVGLVIVSHSRALADALIELIRQVTDKDIPVVAAAGVGDDRREFGTDATEIMAAIESVYTPDGVVVLMDLGSAVLSAETALELMPEDRYPRIRFCDAPLVEGAIAAGVQIGLGSDLDIVYREARQALVPKIRQLSPEDQVLSADDVPDKLQQATDDWQEIVLTVNTPHGLHARPAARFVQTANRFQAEIWVYKTATPQAAVAATSLNSLATLGVVRGDQIAVSARGPEAAAALAALKHLVEEQLTEFVESAASTSLKPARTQNGSAVIAVSEGVAVAPLSHFKPPLPEISADRIDDPDSQWARLNQALAATRQAIEKRRRQLASRVGETRASIFDAHILILQDPALLEQTRERIFKHRHNAASAWQHSINSIADTYRALSDPYLQQRAVDVLDVGNQVLAAMMGQAAVQSIAFSRPVILVAEDINPTQIALLDTKKVMGLATVEGGSTSHSAILTRALGIPAVSGMDPFVLSLAQDTSLALDGFEGKLWINPPKAVVENLQKRRSEWLTQREKLRRICRQPAVTKDGHRIIVAANLANVRDAEPAVANGAEAVGVLRTEFLYLTRSAPPTEDEQVDGLCQIGRAMGTRPICVRTLDAGGDKPLPYIQHAAEANPYLGLRAIRLSLHYPQLFRTQLRAILRAAAEFELRVMFPMISTVDEITQAVQVLREVHQELQQDNISHRWPIPTGMMIEIPAAALLCSAFARDMDFFSIGTNDLTQYTLAAERGNPQLSAYSDALHPAVLHLIHRVVDAAHPNGKPVAVCGEIAADPEAVPVLVGLGVDELSVNPDAIGRVKAAIRKMDYSAAAALTAEILQTENATAVRQLAKRLVC